MAAGAKTALNLISSIRRTNLSDNSGARNVLTPLNHFGVLLILSRYLSRSLGEKTGEDFGHRSGPGRPILGYIALQHGGPVLTAEMILDITCAAIMLLIPFSASRIFPRLCVLTSHYCRSVIYGKFCLMSQVSIQIPVCVTHRSCLMMWKHRISGYMHAG